MELDGSAVQACLILCGVYKSVGRTVAESCDNVMTLARLEADVSGGSQVAPRKTMALDRAVVSCFAALDHIHDILRDVLGMSTDAFDRFEYEYGL